MKDKALLQLLVATAVSLFAGCSTTDGNKPAAPRDEAAVQAALQAAEAWLELVDAGRYEQSWLASAELFRKAVPQQQWIRSMTAFRQPLGAPRSRRLLRSRYTTTAPGAPDGQYVILQFETSFEHKASAVETVTPMLDKDGTWRVSGYYIK